MKYRNRQTVRRRFGGRRLAAHVALILLIVLIAAVSVLLNGCAGLLSSDRTASDADDILATGTSVKRTTTTTLSVHERIQQEQAAVEMATTTSSIDPESEAAPAPTAGTSSTATSTPVVALSDGSIMSVESFEAILWYVNDITPLAEEQSELTAALDPDLSFDFGNVTSRDVQQYRQAVDRQESVWNELANMQAPARMAESHQLRILAARQIYEAAATMIGEIQNGRYHAQDSQRMAAGREKFEAGLSKLADAEFGLTLWEQLLEGARIQ